jgi:hypothetical protein
MANPAGAAVNGFVGGAAGVAGMVVMGAAMAHPGPAAVVAGAGAAYGYVASDSFREGINGTARHAYEAMANGIADANNPDQDYNGANQFANFATVTGVAVSLMTANPAFAYAGAAAGSAAIAIRAKERGQCVIL